MIDNPFWILMALFGGLVGGAVAYGWVRDRIAEEERRNAGFGDFDDLE